MPIVSRSRSRIEIPTSTQRSRNRAVVISRLLFACFFNVNLGYEIISPEFQNFRQNLIDGKHLEILKPFILLSSCSPFFYVFNVILPYSFIVSQKSVGDNKKATDRVT